MQHATTPMPDHGPLLEAVDVCRAAEDGTLLLQDVSLAVAAGSSTAVTGPPGAGKTLLLRTLALLDPVQGGEVRFRGEPIADLAVPAFRGQVLLVPQRPVLIEGTVRDNLQLPFTLSGWSDRRFDERSIADRLGAMNREATFLNREARDLSGGESQLVALLRAIQLDPLVLLLDEPTSSLDTPATAAAEQLLTDWRAAEGDRALVVVTHTVEQAARIAGRTIVMERGAVNPSAENALDAS